MLASPEHAVLNALLTCGLGAFVCWLFGGQRRLAGWTAFCAVFIASGFALIAAGKVVLTGTPGTPLTFWTLRQLGFALRIHVDGLSAIFLTLIAVVAPLAALYSIPYLEHYRDYPTRRYYPHLLLFLAGMIGLVTTTDAMFFFFVFWQLMTLTSYLLIRFEHRNPVNIRAANRYLLMMQLACGITMVGAELLARSAVTVGIETLMKYDFEAISHHLPALLATSPGLVTLAFGCFLVGFGIKAGMWPFGQAWLPDAHPAAPSPVSALLSGVMIKTGVYGLMRYFLWLTPLEAQSAFPLRGWGVVMAVLGTLTLFVGTLQALKQEQSKRLLAFHSIGQVGYILLGLGASLVLLRSAGPGMAVLAAFGFYGALFHTLNHGFFKSLLFLNAGSMLHATGTQDLNRLGGLMKWMPITGITALIAAFSISGVPLFNGFASKWSIYVSTIQGGKAVGFLPVCGVIAILTSALTLASFIKFFGSSFLARTSGHVRAQAARHSMEVNGLMQAPQIALAVLCVTLGLAPTLAFVFIRSSLQASRQGLAILLADAIPLEAGSWQGLEVVQGGAVFGPLVVALALGGMMLVARAVSRLGGAEPKSAPPWLCGYAQDNDAVRYHAHSFYGEFKKCVRWAGGNPPPPQSPGAAVSAQTRPKPS